MDSLSSSCVEALAESPESWGMELAGEPAAEPEGEATSFVLCDFLLFGEVLVLAASLTCPCFGLESNRRPKRPPMRLETEAERPRPCNLSSRSFVGFVLGLSVVSRPVSVMAGSDND